MTILSARDVVLGYFADLDAGRSDAAFARIAPDVIYHVKALHRYGGVFDEEGMKRIARGVFGRLAAHLRVSRSQVVADERHVVIEPPRRRRPSLAANMPADTCSCIA